jgi:glycosyltransferase involved in cell wall biosynthesis
MKSPGTNHPLRIGMFSWESMHSVRVGGLAQAVTNLSQALAKKGHEVHLFTRIGENQSEHEQINGVHYHRCKFHHGNNLLEFARNMCGAMVGRFHATEEIAGKFDLVHGHDWLVVDALHELKNEGYPVILTYHSTEYGRNGGEFGDWWEFGEVSNKEWYGGYIADRVTTISRTMRNELMWLYGTPEWKIDVAPNGGYIQEFTKKVDPGRIKERYGIHPLAPVVLFVGRLVHQKGPDLLIEAVPHVLRHRGDVKFIVAGGGDGGMRDYLERRARELKISDSVRFLGYVPDKEYTDILNACDVVCIPSRNEPFGLVLFEAWAAEKAVVATAVGGLGENIENFVDGIKVFGYPESIAWGINYIVSDPVGVRWLGANGKRKLRKSTWSRQASKYEKIYAKLM